MTDSVVHHRLTQLDEQFIKHRIALLERADLTTARIERLKSKLIDLLRAYVVSPLEIRKGEPVFRARKHREDEKQKDGVSVLLNHVDCIYPQSQYIKQLGRANRKNQCIYYFAADDGVALTEVKPKIGDVVTILECKPIGDSTPSLIPIGIHQMAKEHGARIGGGFPAPDMRIESLFHNDRASIGKHKMIDDFILKEFLRVVDDGDEYLYKLTIAVAELLFTFEADLSEFGIDLGFVDGLAYPSIAAAQINANLALRPEAFHRIYKPTACKWMRMEEPRRKSLKRITVDGFLVSERMAKRIRADGSIEW